MSNKSFCSYFSYHHLYILLIVAISIVVYLLQTGNNKEIHISNFINKDSKDCYTILLKKYKSPDVIYNKPGGFVVWYPKQTDPKSIFSSLMLKDESLTHLDHKDFLYGTVIVELTDEQLNKIIPLSKSFFYDRGTKELTIRCNSLNNLNALFYLLFSKLDLQSSEEINETTVLQDIKNGDKEWTKNLEYHLLSQIDTINREKLKTVGNEKFQIPLDGSKRKVVRYP